MLFEILRVEIGSTVSSVALFKSYHYVKKQEAPLPRRAQRVRRAQFVYFITLQGVAWNQIYTNKTQNCTNFNSVQEIDELFSYIVRFTEFVNSNMLPEFSREPRELP